jgi:membrane-bound metal-dependent hydrolase YbcI (DUF457 family)
MAQAGFHGMVGLAVRKWMPKREWLMLGVVLGNLLPDADNLAVAIATLTGGSTEGLHRTFTHSLFFIAFLVVLFYVISFVARNKRWSNLGWGLGLGVLMHVLLDLLVWFNGVEILWPLDSWVNLWPNIVLPDWWTRLMLPLENATLALFFVLLGAMARKQGTDQEFLGKLNFWMWVQVALTVLFLVMVFTMESGYMTIFGAVYLLSLFLAAWITCRMRRTIEVSL